VVATPPVRKTAQGVEINRGMGHEFNPFSHLVNRVLWAFILTEFARHPGAMIAYRLRALASFVSANDCLGSALERRQAFDLAGGSSSASSRRNLYVAQGDRNTPPRGSGAHVHR
jgi:hypothetical protein